MKKIVSLITGIAFVAGISLTIVLAANSSDTPETAPSPVKMDTQESNGPSFATISPELEQDAGSVVLVGTVLSHETANVYPRREGVVQDIYVDIGDKVEKDQVIALLLPRGVEGQSEAVIAEKQARVDQARSNLYNTDLVAKAAVENARQQLMEKKVALLNAENNTAATVAQVETIATATTENETAKTGAALQQIEVAKANIRTTEDALGTARQDQESKLKKGQADIPQMLDQAEVQVAHAQETVEGMLSNANNTARNRYDSLHPYEIPVEFGFYNQNSRGNLAGQYTLLRQKRDVFEDSSSEEKQKQIFSLLEDAYILLDNTRDVLQASFSGKNLSEERLNSLLNTTHNSQSSLLKARENLEDALNAYEVLSSSESKTITLLQSQLAQQKELLRAAEENLRVVESGERKSVDVAYKELDKTKVSQTSEVELRNTQVRMGEENLALIQAQQQKLVAAERNALRVVESSLRAELASSGHYELRSPFRGVVAKRSLEVGEAVMPSMPAFQLVNVETTLAQRSKREIQFGVPEEIQDVVKIGDRIEFFLPGNEEEKQIAEVTRISPQVDEMSHTITVQAKISDQLKLPHHTSVRVRLATQEFPIYRLPATVIKREEDQNFIWVLSENSEPEKVMVNVLAEDGEFAEVTGELTTEVQVITDPPDQFVSPLSSPS